MNELQIFENELFKVSAKTDGEQILFEVEQVAKSLGFTQTKGNKEYIRWETVNRYLEKYVSQQVGKGDLIPEPLVYKLAFKAQNEVAEKFQDWLAIEVIPKIRKTGGYVQEDRADDFVNAWLPQLDDVSRKAIATALESNRKLQTENKELITTIQEQRPKVVFAESCLVSNDAVLVKDVAKLACDQGMKIGQNRLYNKLREWGYIQKKDTQPTQRAIESGFFEILQRSIQTPEGSKLTRTTKVTPKGQMHIINKLKKEQLEGVFN